MTLGDPDPLVGTTIGPCRIKERLAAGGMGVVYRASHRDKSEDVAVKILAPSLAADQEYVARFFREAGAAGQISHPNVVKVLDSGDQDGRYYLIMDFIDGKTLDEILETAGRLSLDRATRIIRQIACGLAAAHEQGIIHRDVKPGNILITRRDKSHLTDFGLARRTHTRKGLTVEGTFLGTPEYASPEQVEGRKIDHRTDIYSLGVSYYQLLSGSLPFTGTTPMEIAVKRTREDPRPLGHTFPGADKRTCAIVKRMLERNPERRYETSQQLILDLEAILAGRFPPTAMPAEAVKKRSPLSVAAQRRIRSILHWSLMVIGVTLAFGSGLLAPRPEGVTSLGAWSEQDPEFMIRLLLLIAGSVAGLGAIFVYRREMLMSGKIWGLLGVVILMLLGGLSTGVLLERQTGQGSMETFENALSALGSKAGDTANLLALALLLVFTSCLFSFSSRAQFASLVFARVGLVAAFLLLYAFGTSDVGLKAPFVNYVRTAELAIPLTVVAGLGVVIGILLLTAPQAENVSRVVGLVLLGMGFFAQYLFVILVSQPDTEGWSQKVMEPFFGIGMRMLHVGSLLAGVIALGLVAQGVVVVGIDRYDRFFAKR